MLLLSKIVLFLALVAIVSPHQPPPSPKPTYAKLPAGPAGLPGPAGPTGAAGPAGPQGSPGATGPEGPQGSPGAFGPAGLQGSPGATGPAGPVGSPGATGATGASGATGSQGSSGAMGPQGFAGPAGGVGSKGSQGAAGSKGLDGAKGATGAVGPQGQTGLAGAQGLPGLSGLIGGATGQQGDSGCGSNLKKREMYENFVKRSSEPYLGEIAYIPYKFAPRGWALCNGQLLSIAQNTALFSLIGTYYGGNGIVNFALPYLNKLDSEPSVGNCDFYIIALQGIFPARN